MRNVRTCPGSGAKLRFYDVKSSDSLHSIVECPVCSKPQAAKKQLDGKTYQNRGYVYVVRRHIQESKRPCAECSAGVFVDDDFLCEECRA